MLESINLSVCIYDLLNCGRNVLYDIRLRHWIVNISWFYKCTTIKCVLVVNWIIFYNIKMKKFPFLFVSESFENTSLCSFYFLHIRTKPNVLPVIPESKSPELWFAILSYSRRSCYKNSNSKSSARPHVYFEICCWQNNEKMCTF